MFHKLKGEICLATSVLVQLPSTAKNATFYWEMYICWLIYAMRVLLYACRWCAYSQGA